MLKKRISDIVYEAASAPDKQMKIAILRKNDSPQLRGYLGLTMDKNAVWDLPEGAPPFKENKFPDSEIMMYTEFRRMYLFLKGGHPTLKPSKREGLFIGLLESLDAKDSKFLIEVVKAKKLPQGLTARAIKEAFFWL